MVDEFGVTYCEDIVCLQSLSVCFSDPLSILLNSTYNRHTSNKAGGISAANTKTHHWT